MKTKKIISHKFVIPALIAGFTIFGSCENDIEKVNQITRTNDMASLIVNEIETIYTNEISLLKELKTKTQQIFPHSIISIGDTPGLCQIEKIEGIDEIRPGNFVFFDCMQEKLGACTFNEVAVALACPIVEINAKQEKIVVYGGAIHLSKEFIAKDGSNFYGAVVKFENKKWSAPLEHVYVKSLSQEHGILHCPKAKIKDFKVGDIIGILPVHSCLTANLMKGYYDFEGNYIDHMNNFE